MSHVDGPTAAAGDMSHHILVLSAAGRFADALAADLEVVGFCAHSAADTASAVEAASRWPLDLIIVDVPGDGHGRRALLELAATPATSTVPVLAAIDEASVEDRLEILQAGADGLLEKPPQLPELVERVRSMLRRSDQLRNLSPLTGLPGNRAIAAALRERLAEPEPVAFVHIDIKHFKQFNDRCGFLAGDGMIRRCADCLQEAAAAIRTSVVFVGHIGGDDFAAVVAAVDVDRFCRTLIELWDARVVATMVDGVGAERGIDASVSRPVELAVGVATNLHRDFSSEWEVTAIAAEMKEYAKQLPGSTYRIDRRRGPAPELPAGSVYNERTKKPPSGQGAIPDRR